MTDTLLTTEQGTRAIYLYKKPLSSGLQEQSVASQEHPTNFLGGLASKTVGIGQKTGLLHQLTIFTAADNAHASAPNWVLLLFAPLSGEKRFVHQVSDCFLLKHLSMSFLP
uniref:Uncharacterized protein n=1 Tax=Eutreptiella gymnastica TaxID=73025 RepID=A0A7S1IR10_9EUGL